VSIDTNLLDLYVGRYGNPETTMTIARSGNHLIAHVLGFTRFSVYPYTDRDFFATTSPQQISFVTDDHGKIIRLVRHKSGEDVTLRRLDQTECSSEAGTAQCSQ
jgi:hypothetical protein